MVHAHYYCIALLIISITNTNFCIIIVSRIILKLPRDLHEGCACQGYGRLMACSHLIVYFTRNSVLLHVIQDGLDFSSFYTVLYLAVNIISVQALGWSKATVLIRIYLYIYRCSSSQYNNVSKSVLTLKYQEMSDKSLSMKM